jgi:hypothetical protein
MNILRVFPSYRKLQEELKSLNEVIKKKEDDTRQRDTDIKRFFANPIVEKTFPRVRLGVFSSIHWPEYEFRCFVNEIDKQAADLEFEARVRAIKCKPEGK